MTRPDNETREWFSPHGTTWQAETYEEALEAERDSLAAELAAARRETETVRQALEAIAFCRVEPQVCAEFARAALAAVAEDEPQGKTT